MAIPKCWVILFSGRHTLLMFDDRYMLKFDFPNLMTANLAGLFANIFTNPLTI